MYSQDNQTKQSSKSSKKKSNFEIKGVLRDGLTKESLEAATIYLESVRDSTLITYTISNQKGAFLLEGKTQVKKARVNVSFIGYESYEREVDISQNLIDMGDIFLRNDVSSLDEVVIWSRAPVTVKKDTLEFNVSSFKTKKDATIEDLLKELPGVTVDKDGVIKVNGKEVNNILVNGKPFFGDDPTIATRNLTKDIIERIQVTDTKTDGEALTGESGDQESKTINLTIKEENNKGVFGRLAAGGGTDDRFEYAGLLNLFNNDSRISFLVGGNNQNNPGFSYSELRDNFNSNFPSTFFTGDSGGIVTSRNTGVNYADTFTEGFDINTNYFYSGANSFNETTTERENILPDQRFFTNSSSRQDGNLDDHSVDLSAKVKVDSTFLITIRPGFGFNTNRSRFSNEEESLDENQAFINSSSSNSTREATNRSFRNILSVTKRFGERGSFIRANVINSIDNGTNDEFLTTTTLFNQEANEDDIIRNQFTNGESAQKSFSAAFTYRYPLLAKKLFLDLRLNHLNDRDENRLNTFDFNENTQNFDNFNTLLSTDFTFINRETTPGAKLSYEKDKWRVGLQSDIVFRNLKNQDLLRPQLNVDRDFTALELRSDVRYDLASQKSLSLRYTLNNNSPQANQLSSFEDVTNPLNIRQGNPNLQPTNTHDLWAFYNAYNLQKKLGFYGSIRGSLVDNAIVSKTTTDENLLRRTTYENVQGNYRTSITGTLYRDVKIDSTVALRYSYLPGVFLNRTINFNNDVQYASLIRNISSTLHIDLVFENTLGVSLIYSSSFSRTSFDLDVFQNQDFTNHSVSLESSFSGIKNWEWSNNISYILNPNVADNFQRSAVFWNSSLYYYILKEKGKISFEVYDLLRQNTNASRNATANFIQDVQSTVLQQYFLLGFSWKFNSLKGKE